MGGGAPAIWVLQTKPVGERVEASLVRKLSWTEADDAEAGSAQVEDWHPTYQASRGEDPRAMSIPMSCQGIY
jgi:hypothetical protein